MTGVEVSDLKHLGEVAELIENVTNTGPLYVWFEPGTKLPVYDERNSMVIGYFAYDSEVENIVFVPEVREPVYHDDNNN